MDYSVKVSCEVNTDVLVIGAGTAGVFAAISAAKSGSSVLLVEKNAMPGGTMCFCGVDYPGIFHAWGKQIIDGPCYESILRAKQLGGAIIPEIVYKPERHWMMQIRLNTFTYVHVLEQMLSENSVEVLYHTMLSSIKETENGVEALFAGKDGNILVKAKAAVDATGDANAVSKLGYPLLKSDILQPATLINNLGGYDLSDIDEKKLDEVFADAFDSGELSKRDLQGQRPIEILKDARIHSHIHTGAPEKSDGKTLLEIQSREAVFRVLSVFRRVKGLEKIQVISFSPESGVRESVRIDALTNVTAEDYVAGRKYDDSVCYAFYPIDLHTDHAIKQVFLSEGVVPCIPYSALIPKNSRFILAAGRCVGSDTDANSALRVQAPCMAMGQAAGVAAAIMAENGSDNRIDVNLLKESLKKLGAIVP